MECWAEWYSFQNDRFWCHFLKSLQNSQNAGDTLVPFQLKSTLSFSSLPTWQCLCMCRCVLICGQYPFRKLSTEVRQMKCMAVITQPMEPARSDSTQVCHQHHVQKQKVPANSRAPWGPQNHQPTRRYPHLVLRSQTRFTCFWNANGITLGAWLPSLGILSLALSGLCVTVRHNWIVSSRPFHPAPRMHTQVSPRECGFTQVPCQDFRLCCVYLKLLFSAQVQNVGSYVAEMAPLSLRISALCFWLHQPAGSVDTPADSKLLASGLSILPLITFTCADI